MKVLLLDLGSAAASCVRQVLESLGREVIPVSQPAAPGEGLGGAPLVVVTGPFLAREVRGPAEGIGRPLAGDALVPAVRAVAASDVSEIIVVADGAGPAEAELLVDAGASDVVCWPEEATSLAPRLRAALRRIARRHTIDDDARQLRALVDHASDAIFIKDRAGRYLLFNPASARLVGREALGHTDVEVFGTEAGREMQAIEERIMATGEPISYERTRVINGRQCVLFTAKVPYRIGGEIVGIIGITRDVTEREHTHAESTLADRMASLGTLAAGIAHEIASPLTYVAASLDLCRHYLKRVGAGTDVEELRESVEHAREGCSRMRDIVLDLRTFTRGDEAASEPVDVHRAVEFALRLVKAEAAWRTTVEKDFGHVPLVRGNLSRLGQVFVNLLINAIHALPERPPADNRVRVATRVIDDGRVLVEVSDNGHGIPPEVLPRIFEPFFTTKPVGRGTGLGLSICRNIVHSMQGEISVESEPGRGTTFRVTLPAGPSAVVSPAEAAPRAESGEMAAVAPGEPHVLAAPARARVLVIDDEPGFLHTMERMLGGDFDVTALRSGRAAVELVRRGERFAAVLCDLVMPGMSGIDVYAELASASPETARRMVFLTGAVFAAGARQFLASVPNRRMIKPVGQDAVRSVVREVVAGGEKQA